MLSPQTRAGPGCPLELPCLSCQGPCAHCWTSLQLPRGSFITITHPTWHICRLQPWEYSSPNNLKSFTWHLGKSLYDSNKNSPDKSHIHTMSKHQQILHTEKDTAPFLLHLRLPGFPFSSPVSSDEPIVLFLTLTPPRFPNDGLASHRNCFFFYFENNFPFWGQCHSLESEEMSWYLKQNSALHNTWGSMWLLLKRGARQAKTNPPQNCVNYADNLTSVFTSLHCHCTISSQNFWIH